MAQDASGLADSLLLDAKRSGRCDRCFDGRAGALPIAVAPMPAGEERREAWFV
jgi:hypothetical protein